MQVTETIKAIIELIEPYMDKTLFFGCLLKTWEGEMGEYVSKYNSRGELRYRWNAPYSNEISVYDVGCIIIGHYDITAVENYISNFNNGIINISIIDGYRFYYKNANDSAEDWFLKIPNKPIHLFTQKEDKDLLEGLQKLGNLN